MDSLLTSYLNNQGRKTGNRTYTGRAAIDGLPYRSDRPPTMRDDEFETRTVRSAEAHAEFFNMKDRQHKKNYLAVMEGSARGFFRVVFIDRFHNDEDVHYVEWLEYYYEDGSPAQLGPQNLADFHAN